MSNMVLLLVPLNLQIHLEPKDLEVKPTETLNQVRWDEGGWSQEKWPQMGKSAKQIFRVYRFRVCRVKANLGNPKRILHPAFWYLHLAILQVRAPSAWIRNQDIFTSRGHAKVLGPS